MNKKILIGSMLVLTLLLLMPSIPAIQQKTVEEGFKQDLQEKLDTIDFKDLREIKTLDDDVKHLLLYEYVQKILYFRIFRGFVLMQFSSDYYGNPIYPFIYNWGAWLVACSIMGMEFWLKVSDTYDWGWTFIFI